MCKCCQSILESCYWHCYGKWNFDDDIALYEDESPAEKKKDSHAIDNLAYWDSVQMIASRSVIITQPTPSKPSLGQLEAISTPNKDLKDNQDFYINVVSPSTSNETINSSTLSVPDGQEAYIQITETPTIENCQRNNKYRKNSAATEVPLEKRFLTPNSERVRKKSLKERRNSTAELTLDLSFTQEFHEIPVIRANSMPKHYLSSTPEYNPFAENSVLTNPILPQSFTPQYDLKSVVQFENELENAIAKQTRITRSQSRIANIKRKMVLPMLNKKPSTKSLPDTINHI